MADNIMIIILLVFIIIQNVKITESKFCTYYPGYTYPSYSKTTSSYNCPYGCCGTSCPTTSNYACCLSDYGDNYCDFTMSSTPTAWWTYTILVPIIIFCFFTFFFVCAFLKYKQRRRMMMRTGTNPMVATTVLPGTTIVGTTNSYPVTTTYPTNYAYSNNQAYSTYPTANTYSTNPSYPLNTQNNGNPYQAQVFVPPPIGFNPPPSSNQYSNTFNKY